MAKKRKSNKQKSNDNPLIFIIKKIGFAAVISTIIFFILCAIAALIIQKTDSEPTYFPYVLLIISGVSGIICGIIAILPIKRNGLVIGMASVIPMFFIIFTVITIINKTSISPIGWASLGIMTICGGIGGILGNKK